MGWSGVGAMLMALGVAMGAFGAHALRDRLDAYSLDVYQRAIQYHFLHALGILITPVIGRAANLSQQSITIVCILLSVGIVLFSGSLIALALTGIRVLGAITPLGGVSFIAAWLTLAYFLLKRP